MRVILATIFIIVLIPFHHSCKSSQKGVIASADTVITAVSISSKCFKYSDIRDTIKGIILMHFCANSLCGRMAYASLSLLQTSNNDTLRVLQLCNTCSNGNILKKNDKVTVIPKDKPNFSVGLPMMKVTNGEKEKYEVDPEDCNYKTYFGYLIKTK